MIILICPKCRSDKLIHIESDGLYCQGCGNIFSFHDSGITECDAGRKVKENE